MSVHYRGVMSGVITGPYVRPAALQDVLQERIPR